MSRGVRREEQEGQVSVVEGGGGGERVSGLEEEGGEGEFQSFV